MKIEEEMKMNNKFFIMILLTAILLTMSSCVSSGITAQDLKDDELVIDGRKGDMPSIDKNDILLVGRISVVYDEDLQFFIKTRDVNEKSLSFNNIYSLPCGLHSSFAQQMFDEGDFFVGSYYVEKDRNVKLEYSQYYFYSDVKMMIYLPIYCDFDVPKGEKNIYIGSLTFYVTGDDFTIKRIEIKDEYDQAQEFVSKIKSKDPIKLCRVQLKETKDENKDKD